MASVELRGLTKRYGDVAVVDDISLAIEYGHLVCLLGPSGCGKTTTLRLIAGFVEPSAGEIRVGDKLISSPARSLPPERRNMSMIFQSYALWPHMTVAENIVYGLKLRKLDRDAIAKKLNDILATTKLAPLAERYPGELSGGQQQRVALARALIVEPETLLLDEPLSNLDANLREEMRFEVRRLHDALSLHHGLRHARSVGSDDDRRPHLRDERRQDRAVGLAGRHLRTAAFRIRRAFHRLQQRHQGQGPGRDRMPILPACRCAASARRLPPVRRRRSRSVRTTSRFPPPSRRARKIRCRPR